MVDGIQTNEEVDDKKVTLRGTAQMLPGDDVLKINIPTENQAPVGRFLEVKWEVDIDEPIAVPVSLLWSTLTPDQWETLTADEWSELEP